MKLKEVEKEVREILSKERYLHSLGVEKRAAILAKIYQEDVIKAKLAGIAHDIAKEMTKEEMLKYAAENEIEISEIEKLIPKVLHGKIGASICREKFHFEEELQNAISYHTTGAPNMDLLAKIIYLADMTEETRNFEGIEIIRKLSEENIDDAMLYALNRELKSKIEENKIIHPATLETRNEILKNRTK